MMMLDFNCLRLQLTTRPDNLENPTVEGTVAPSLSTERETDQSQLTSTQVDPKCGGNTTLTET